VLNGTSNKMTRRIFNVEAYFDSSVFGRFKKEDEYLNWFETLAEIIDYIYKQIYYYNYKRIHISLKMSPVQ